MEEIIRKIKDEFQSGKNWIELPADEPQRFYRKLHKAVRRRYLAWRFATTDRSVFVIK